MAAVITCSTLQEANGARKRKAASPAKEGPDCKRQTPVDVTGDAAAKAPQALLETCCLCMATACIMKFTRADKTDCMQNEDSWEQISEELGWSVTDCLNHKLSFKKKDDPKAKHEAMGQHIKRLRAAGWHLLHVMERFDLLLTVTPSLV